jgi:hypothetical protein
VADDGPTVFADACPLGAEGIVSKKVDGAYLSGPCRVWIKVRNPAGIGVQRERSEIGIGEPRGSVRQIHLWISRRFVGCSTIVSGRVG